MWQTNPDFTSSCLYKNNLQSATTIDHKLYGQGNVAMFSLHINYHKKKFRVNKYTFLHEKQILQHFVIEHGDYVDDKYQSTQRSVIGKV